MMDMLFLLKKFLGFWLMPLPLSLALIGMGALLWCCTRWRTLGRSTALGGCVWLGVCSNGGVGTWWVRGLEARFPAQPVLSADVPLPSGLERSRWVAVLGGGHSVVPGWSANQQLSTSALARVVEGVRIVRQLPQARLVVSGPPDGAEGGPAHASLLREVAAALGVEADRIVEISTARDTAEEAAALRRLVGDDPVALVTSAWHMPRAVALCQGERLDVLACPADFAARSPSLRPVDFMTWNVGGLERSTRGIHERLGAAWAWLSG
jgi:uncharacterized SAM-binding protein YcdF (DUF218 family)